MKLSIIIPAYNEEKCIVTCIQSVKEALATIDRPELESEIIVCDNNSKDSTAELAAGEGASVVFEGINQIGRARNTGARAGSGDWLLFVDADSTLKPESVLAMLKCIEGGKYVGGGCRIAMDKAPFSGHLAIAVCNVLLLTLRVAAGSFLFCRADAFNDIGGFRAEIYGGEEYWLSRALQRWGRGKKLRFAVLRTPHISSGRKFYLYSRWELIKVCLQAMFVPLRLARSRDRLFHLYDGRR